MRFFSLRRSFCRRRTSVVVKLSSASIDESNIRCPVSVSVVTDLFRLFDRVPSDLGPASVRARCRILSSISLALRGLAPELRASFLVDFVPVPVVSIVFW